MYAFRFKRARFIYNTHKYSNENFTRNVKWE